MYFKTTQLQERRRVEYFFKGRAQASRGARGVAYALEKKGKVQVRAGFTSDIFLKV